MNTNKEHTDLMEELKPPENISDSYNDRIKSNNPYPEYTNMHSSNIYNPGRQTPDQNISPDRHNGFDTAPGIAPNGFNTISQNRNMQPNGFDNGFQNRNTQPNGFNNGFQNRNTQPNGFNNGFQNRNTQPTGFNNGFQNRNTQPYGFDNGFQNRNTQLTGFNNGFQNRNTQPNGFDNGFQNRNTQPTGFNKFSQNRNPSPSTFNNSFENRNVSPNGFNTGFPNRNFQPNTGVQTGPGQLPNGYSSFNVQQPAPFPSSNGRMRYPADNRQRKRKKPLTKEQSTELEIKKSYNRTCIALLIHDVLIFAIMIFLEIALAFSSITFKNIEAFFADENIHVGTAVISVFALVTSNIICTIIGLGMTKRLREFPKLYSKPKTKLLPALLAFPTVLGFQCVISILHKGYFVLMNIDTSSEVTSNDVNKSIVTVYFVYSVFLAPITEEILFRGMVLKNLSVVDEKFAIFFSAFLFGLFHENILQMVTATLLGILLAYVAIETDSIILPTLLHMFNNLYAEIKNSVPDSNLKTTVVFILYGIGIISAVLFFILTRKKEYPRKNYKPQFELLPSEEKRSTISAALYCPAVIAYLILILLFLSVQVFASFIVSLTS